MVIYFSLGYTLWFISKGHCSEMIPCGSLSRLILLGVLEWDEANCNRNQGVFGIVVSRVTRCGLERFNIANNLQQPFKTTQIETQSKSKECNCYQNAALRKIPYCLLSVRLLPLNPYVEILELALVVGDVFCVLVVYHSFPLFWLKHIHFLYF